MAAIAFARALGALALNIVTAPFWWYSVGLFVFSQMMAESLRRAARNLGIALWAANLFTPMFGQYDRVGRIISFFVRLANVIGRSIALVLFAVWWLILFLIWIAGPVVALVGLFMAYLNYVGQ
ncbi:MAG: hypothetical protein HW383_225 [Candidatus Magasanikbacteria bacterium]|nr:hypothetical protein [Candidatus Magasanikbacteria bacterium]